MFVGWKPPSDLRGHLQFSAMWPSPSSSQHGSLLPAVQQKGENESASKTESFMISYNIIKGMIPHSFAKKCNTVIGMIPHCFIVLIRSKLQFPPTLKGKGLLRHEYQEVGIMGATLESVCQTMQVDLSSRQLDIYMGPESRKEVETRNVNLGVVDL